MKIELAAIEAEMLHEAEGLRVEEKIEEINAAVNGTLSIIHYGKWELASYGKKSLFSLPKRPIRADSFKELIKKAYKEVKKGE